MQWSSTLLRLPTQTGYQTIKYRGMYFVSFSVACSCCISWYRKWLIKIFEIIELELRKLTLIRLFDYFDYFKTITLHPNPFHNPPKTE